MKTLIITLAILANIFVAEANPYNLPSQNNYMNNLNDKFDRFEQQMQRQDQQRTNQMIQSELNHIQQERMRQSYPQPGNPW